jgi:hypothetical protein
VKVRPFRFWHHVRDRLALLRTWRMAQNGGIDFCRADLERVMRKIEVLRRYLPSRHAPRRSECPWLIRYGDFKRNLPGSSNFASRLSLSREPPCFQSCTFPGMFPIRAVFDIVARIRNVKRQKANNGS